MKHSLLAILYPSLFSPPFRDRTSSGFPDRILSSHKTTNVNFFDPECNNAGVNT